MEANTTEPETYSFATTGVPRPFVSPFLESLSLSMGQVEPNSLMEVLSRTIYGSNMILGAGGSLDTTYRICHAVFNELPIPEELTKGDSVYEEITDHLEFLKIPRSYESVMKCYRETLQHAKAAKYLITRIVIHRQRFDEATFKEANRLLTYNDDPSPQEPWGGDGNYRQWGMTRDPRFLDPLQIPSAMLGMITELAMEMESLDTTPLPLKPEDDIQERIWKACRFCHRFILIHPFVDGNGRLYRLFLTTLLLRAGIPPAVYGLYIPDRMRHEQAEASCYTQDYQMLLNVADLVAFGPGEQLIKFVHEHTCCWWDSPGNYMRTFLHVTGQSTGQVLEYPAASKMHPR
ncbi:uncharacterized protein FTJAE_1598 [Fusarium tjaetaba]|uniref:Fido domain-containing protein n=1 Tax=Fusarium tjaetaba TaxID=1567544 RepID=A0A8H5SB83_9HYPO|nr:uncharacterized protein FTJAE_1598 [Fusarium tjaetaba]KAF5647542.1 hypothetical protein FTJAE_1598 [Fusarium tjaetaba]